VTVARTICGLQAIAGCLVIVVFLVPAPLARAASGITWTPSAMTMTLAPGASYRRVVSATASRHLGDAVVRVAPELQPFVQVEPRELSGITKGQTVYLTVTIAVTPRALPGTAAGAIRLFGELQLGVKGGGIKMLGWPLAFTNPLLVTVEIR
jgi:hypothetical protein